MTNIYVDDMKIKNNGGITDVICNDTFCTINYGDDIEFICSKNINPKSYELLLSGEYNNIENIGFKKFYQTKYEKSYMYKTSDGKWGGGSKTRKF